jgi:hypothetical protein
MIMFSTLRALSGLTSAMRETAGGGRRGGNGWGVCGGGRREGLRAGRAWSARRTGPARAAAGAGRGSTAGAHAAAAGPGPAQRGGGGRGERRPPTPLPGLGGHHGAQHHHPLLLGGGPACGGRARRGGGGGAAAGPGGSPQRAGAAHRLASCSSACSGSMAAPCGRARGRAGGGGGIGCELGRGRRREIGGGAGSAERASAEARQRRPGQRLACIPPAGIAPPCRAISSAMRLWRMASSSGSSCGGCAARSAHVQEPGACARSAAAHQRTIVSCSGPRGGGVGGRCEVRACVRRVRVCAGARVACVGRGRRIASAHSLPARSRSGARYDCFHECCRARAGSGKPRKAGGL